MFSGSPLVVLLSVFWVGSSVGQDLYATRGCEFDDAKHLATKMVCRHLTCELDLHDELRAIRNSNIEELVIESSTFRFFKHDSFVGTKLRVIALKDSSILELTDTHTAFEGLEDHLEKLTVDDGSFVSHWDWSHLKNLRKLNSLAVRGSDLVYLPDSLQDVSNTTLERVQFPYNDIAWVHDEAFARFSEMNYLMLEYNEIKSLKRSMFPGLPNKLRTLNLRHNLIKTLPEDIFSDMPNLKSIVLDENMLSTIDEKVFGDVWGQLLLLQINDGSLVCDCHLEWIVTRQPRPRLVYSMCDKPAKLRGRMLPSLKRKELVC